MYHHGKVMNLFEVLEVQVQSDLSTIRTSVLVNLWNFCQSASPGACSRCNWAEVAELYVVQVEHA